MRKNVITLAGKEFEIKVNFRNEYKLTKFRNRMSYGIDFTEKEKPALKEIMEMQKEFEEGKDLDDIDLSKLSPEALDILDRISKEKTDIFTDDELIEMGKILTGIDSDEEIEKLFDEEVRTKVYEGLVANLTYCITMVFTNAKDTSNQEEKVIQIV